MHVLCVAKSLVTEVPYTIICLYIQDKTFCLQCMLAEIGFTQHKLVHSGERRHERNKCLVDLSQLRTWILAFFFVTLNATILAPITMG